MDREELAQYYMRAKRQDEKEREIMALKERKRELKQTIKTVTNYLEMLEAQYESILDRLDYITLYQ